VLKDSLCCFDGHVCKTPCVVLMDMFVRLLRSLMVFISIFLYYDL
jgi:hypothetical protein